MGNWKEFIKDDDSGVHKHKSRKPDKTRFCRKNKLQGGRFGYHEWNAEGYKCIRCGHLKKEQSFGELINNEQQ